MFTFRCGHCKRLAPEYEAAATRLKGIVPLAKVDCTANSNVCGKYGVSGYPTLKIFRDGEDSGGYDGHRTADGIVSHLKKQAGPASVELKSEAEFEKFIGGRDASVVGFFADGGSVAQGEFLKAASALRESYRFGHTNVEDLLKKHDDDGEYVLKGKDLLVAYYDVDYEKNPKGSNYWRNRVMKVAKSFLDQGKKLSFAVANKNSFSHDVSELGLDGSSGELPLVGIRTAKGDKYVMKEEFSRDGKTLEKFLQDYFDGNLKRYLKSEPIPENNDGPVKVIVAENFDSIVNDESKDVLIEFYAPWCGHCKSLEPKYKELGEKLSGDPNIVIAKMDATANDVPSQYEVRGFPTIYFSPAGQKQNPKKYEATNTVVMQEDEKKSKKKKKSEL
uniref:protein disulfide-isomerase n=1 Tax=Cyprinus carpio TaxID=7962 RepID=A0A8C2Q4P8_CYPCA